MANPFHVEFADDRRLVQAKIAPMVYRSDLYVRMESEITQLTRVHIRAFGYDVPLRQKVTLH